MTEQDKVAVAKLNADLMSRCVCRCDDDGNIVSFCGEHKSLMMDEYERGKRHGAADRKMIERQNQALSREIQQLKTELAKLKLEMHKNQK
jgi:hypothetical protein